MKGAPDKVLQLAGSLVVVALSSFLWIGGASRIGARAETLQSGTQAAPGSAPTPGSRAGAARADADALRKRAEDLYGLMQVGRWDKAESFISADSRENFHNAQKSAFLGFKIGSVKVLPDGTDATVEVTMQIITANVAAPGPINVPQKSRWRRMDGVWYMVVPAAENQGAQSAALFSKTERQAAPKPEELKFKGHRYTLGAVQPDQVKTARFPFTNVADHVVTLSDVVTGCDCLQVKLTKKEYKPGESGELEIQFNPKGFEREYMQTIVVKTEPGGLTTHLTVLAYVLGPDLHPQDRGSKGQRSKPARGAATPAANSGQGRG